jgi:hypothetical protein
MALAPLPFDSLPLCDRSPARLFARSPFALPLIVLKFRNNSSLTAVIDFVRFSGGES